MPPQKTPQHIFARLRGDSGQSLIEFGFALPLLLLVILALVDFGRAVNTWLDATHVANEGARLAVVNGTQLNCGDLANLIKTEAYGDLKSGKVTISFPGTGVAIGQPVRVTVTSTYNYSPAGFIPGSFPLRADATMRLEQAATGFPTAGCRST
jgi:Flp pilus assembly protein TadG